MSVAVSNPFPCTTLLKETSSINEELQTEDQLERSTSAEKDFFNQSSITSQNSYFNDLLTTTNEKNDKISNSTFECDSSECLDTKVSFTPTNSIETVCDQNLTKVEDSNKSINADFSPQLTSVSENVSEIPGKDTLYWKIKDFNNFRNAFSITDLPPLTSPEFGNGCNACVRPYDKNGHIVAWFEVSPEFLTSDGLLYFSFSVVKPDKTILKTARVELRLYSLNKNSTNSSASSKMFRLTRSGLGLKPRYNHLVFDNTLHILITQEYYPFYSCVFRGLPSIKVDNKDRLNYLPNTDLLHDIREYCRLNSSKNIEIKCGNTIFNVCKFLVCARSKKLKSIIDSTTKFSSLKTVNKSEKYVLITGIPHNILNQILVFIHTDTCEYLENPYIDIRRLLTFFEYSDAYEVTSLTSRLLKVISQRINRDNFAFYYDSLDRIQSDEFKQLCNDFMNSIPGSHVGSIIKKLTNSGTSSPRTLSTSV